jgi:3-hydroxyacyl-[acyl-carrier-protein] dehydratase
VHFIFIDELTRLEPGMLAEARKTFDPADDIFADHFPGMPLVPGSLLSEAMSQTGGWLVSATEGFTCWPLVTAVTDAKFRRLVRPGETLTLIARLTARRSRDFEVTAETRVGEGRVASARLLFHGFDVTADASPALREWVRRTYDAIGGPKLLSLPAVG